MKNTVIDIGVIISDLVYERNSLTVKEQDEIANTIIDMVLSLDKEELAQLEENYLRRRKS